MLIVKIILRIVVQRRFEIHAINSPDDKNEKSEKKMQLILNLFLILTVTSLIMNFKAFTFIFVYKQY